MGTDERMMIEAMRQYKQMIYASEIEGAMLCRISRNMYL